MKLFFCLCLMFNGLFDDVHCLPEELFVNSECHNGDGLGLEGICKLKPDCPKAEKDVDKYGYHNLTRCGFDNFTEIVCCPVAPALRLINATSDKSDKACTNYTNIPFTLDPFISNGANASLGEFPYMAALFLSGANQKHFQFVCGGTLISDKYVVTAAHCIINIHGLELKAVRLGSIEVPLTVDALNPETDYNVKNYTLHPRFRRRNNFNDIALVELEKSVLFGPYLRPACLFTKRNEYPEEYVIIGWGSLDMDENRSDILQKAAISFVPHKDCVERYKKYNRSLQNTHICAVHATRDTCHGDSGGPLLRKDSTIPVLVGVTTHGTIGCGNGVPSVYISISNYLNWIETIVWP